LVCCFCWDRVFLIYDWQKTFARIQVGVVKITTKPGQGAANIGTWFIVRVEPNAAYIVMAADVIAGDAQPRVEFFMNPNLPVRATVLNKEGDERAWPC
jgi:hypothetical protein